MQSVSVYIYYFHLYVDDDAGDERNSIERIKRKHEKGFRIWFGFVNGELGAYSLQTESSKEGDGNLIEKGTKRERLSPS